MTGQATTQEAVEVVIDKAPGTIDKILVSLRTNADNPLVWVVVGGVLAIFLVRAWRGGRK